jgi:hypothetical protein
VNIPRPFIHECFELLKEHEEQISVLPVLKALLMGHGVRKYRQAVARFQKRWIADAGLVAFNRLTT